jgi:acyl-CoA reductase-like NAD-dependent aldehyde dehydrogenase
MSVFHAHDPRTGAPLGPAVHEDGPIEVDAAVAGAVRASTDIAGLAPEARAELLERIATELDATAEELVARADAETALGSVRLTGELARTTSQLRAFAGVVRDGAHLGVVIDHADATRTPAQPDLRRTLVPLGPVVVFGASNFPLAFGVAGGDTASALAAGCPVVAKAHPSNAGTSALLAEAIAASLTALGLPQGVFGLLQGAGHEVGAALVTHPDITAVGFTGSLAGGRALHDLAAARAVPIPVFAEMGSHNPVWVTPAALARRGPAIAAAIGASATLGAGQFCTRPSVVFLPADDLAAAEGFGVALAETMAAATMPPMLDARISAAFLDRRARLRAIDGVRSLDAAGSGSDASDATVLHCDLATWRTSALVREECFGPLVVVVPVEVRELVATCDEVPGGLTASVWSEPEDPTDLALARAIVDRVTRRVGRVLHDGVPTGVAVSWAQQHGGPYPATTAASTTSVGMHAIDRFLRPVAFQDMPAAMLPPWLHDDNPWRLPRRVDGVLELP